MQNIRSRTGSAFVCDTQGRVLHLIRDNLAHGPIFAPGDLFTSQVARTQLPDALDFLMTIKKEAAVYMCPLTIEKEGRNIPLLFNGVLQDDTIAVLAVVSNAQDSSSDESSSLEEFTRINNELSNLHRALAKQNAELTRLNDQKNEFLGMAAHDLRGSIWMIQLHCKLLLHKTVPEWNQDMQESLISISKTADSLQRILTDYLTISAIEAGKPTLNFEQRELAPLIRQGIQINQVLAESKEITLEPLIEESNRPIRLDAEKILQVLNNLIENAIKFSPRGALVTVRLFQSLPQEVLLSVEDRGRGIATEELERIFESFNRGQKSKDSHEKGSGLGLAIAKKIVEAHGGRIWVESTLGKGSVFFAAFPAK